MRWIGASIGAFLGASRGVGLLGGVIGAVVGNWVEDKVRGRKVPAQESAPAEDHYDDDPYAMIGCRRDASDDELRDAYHEKAKKLHPDVLRAKGLSEELIALASAQMSRINEAWARIKIERRI